MSGDPRQEQSIEYLRDGVRSCQKLAGPSS